MGANMNGMVGMGNMGAGMNLNLGGGMGGGGNFIGAGGRGAFPGGRGMIPQGPRGGLSGRGGMMGGGGMGIFFLAHFFRNPLKITLYCIDLTPFALWIFFLLLFVFHPSPWNSLRYFWGH
jgi:hypothetical protein